MRLLLYIAVMLAVVNLVHRYDRAQVLPMVTPADWPSCIPSNNSPLESPHRIINFGDRKKDTA
jgi:hypothetical protein